MSSAIAAAVATIDRRRRSARLEGRDVAVPVHDASGADEPSRSDGTQKRDAELQRRLELVSTGRRQ